MAAVLPSRKTLVLDADRPQALLADRVRLDRHLEPSSAEINEHHPREPGGHIGVRALGLQKICAHE